MSALEAAAVAPAQVHAQQHLGPVLAVGAACAAVDREDRVRAVVLATQHLLELGALDRLLERVQGGREILLHVLARLGPFDQDPGVVLLGPEST